MNLKWIGITAMVQCVWLSLWIGPLVASDRASGPSAGWWLLVQAGAVMIPAFAGTKAESRPFLHGYLAAVFGSGFGVLGITLIASSFEPPNAPHDWGQGVGMATLVFSAPAFLLSPLAGLTAIVLRALAG